MTKAELLRNQREEMAELTNECMDEIVANLPIAQWNDNGNNGLTIAEIYEVSNKFLSQQSIAYYLTYRDDIVKGERVEEIFFAEIDSKGKLVRNGRRRKDKISKTTYARLADIEEVEEEEEDYQSSFLIPGIPPTRLPPLYTTNSYWWASRAIGTRLIVYTTKYTTIGARNNRSTTKNFKNNCRLFIVFMLL